MAIRLSAARTVADGQFIVKFAWSGIAALGVARVMAWHLRTALGDALWRSEAGIHLPDHRTPSEWVDDLTARFNALGIDPEVPPALV